MNLYALLSPDANQLALTMLLSVLLPAMLAVGGRFASLQRELAAAQQRVGALEARLARYNGHEPEPAPAPAPAWAPVLTTRRLTCPLASASASSPAFSCVVSQLSCKIAKPSQVLLEFGYGRRASAVSLPRYGLCDLS